MTIEKLLVELGLDPTDFKRGANEARRDMEGLNEMLSSFGMVGVGLTAATAGLAAIAREAVNAAGSLEQTKIGFSTMLGSAEEANKFLKELEDFAARTPFQFNELVTGAKRLMAMGFAAQEVRPMLEAVGDAVAALGGSGEMIQRVTLALGQMRAKGKVSAEEMRQLAEAGIPAWQMLADTIGTSIPQAMKMAERGTVKADQAIAGIIEGMNKRFGGLMEMQSQTLMGRFSTLKDELEFALRDMGSALLPFAGQMLEFATLSVKGLKMLVEGFNALPGPVKNIIILFGGVAASIGPALIAVTGFIKSLMMFQTALATVNGALVAHRAATLATIDPLMTAGGAATTAAGGFSALRLAILGAATAFGAIIVAAALWYENKKKKELEDAEFAMRMQSRVAAEHLKNLDEIKKQSEASRKGQTRTLMDQIDEEIAAYKKLSAGGFDAAKKAEEAKLIKQAADLMGVEVTAIRNVTQAREILAGKSRYDDLKKEREEHEKLVKAFRENAMEAGKNAEETKKIGVALEAVGNYLKMSDSGLQQFTATLRSYGTEGAAAASQVQDAWESANEVRLLVSRNVGGTLLAPMDTSAGREEAAAMQKALDLVKQHNAALMDQDRLRGAIRKLYEGNVIDEALYRELIGLNKVSEGTDKTKEATEKWVDSLSDALQAAASLKTIFGNTFGNIVAQLGTMASGFSKLFGKGGLLSQGFSGLFGKKDAEGKLLGGFDFKSIVGGLASAIPAIGALAGPVLGAISSWFEGRKLKKIGKEAGAVLGESVSKETAKAIKETSKELGVSIKEAALLNLDKVMSESKRQMSAFVPQVMGLLDIIKKGGPGAAKALEQVGQAFGKIADEAKRTGVVGSKAVTDILKAARKMGGAAYTEEMKAYTEEKLNIAVEGLKKFVTGISALDGEFARMGTNSATIFMAAFGALVKEKGWVEAVDALGETFDALKEKFKSVFGEDTAAVDAILAPFEKMRAYLDNEVLRGAIDAATGLQQIMVGLADAGYLDAAAFTAMQQTAYDLFLHMTEGGMDTASALLTLAPTISAAVSAAEQFGVPLDADMQKLKEMAEQNGITFETSPMMRMVNALEAIAKVLGAELPSAAASASAALDNVARDRSFKIRYRYESEGPVPPGDPTDRNGDPGYAAGGVASGPESGYWALLHGTEAVVPVDKLDAFIKKVSGGEGGEGGGGQTIVVNVTLPGGEVLKYVEKATKAGMVRVHPNALKGPF